MTQIPPSSETLIKVHFENVRNVQIGGLTDGISLEVAADIGYAALPEVEEVSQPRVPAESHLPSKVRDPHPKHPKHPKPFRGVPRGESGFEGDHVPEGQGENWDPSDVDRKVALDALAKIRAQRTIK